MLKNYFRHLLLEISRLLGPNPRPRLTIEEAVYRIGHLGNMIVLTGHDEVEGFYRTAYETEKNMMGALTRNMCVEDRNR